jgi:tRNA(fMet)-specific endonuclease VapC
MQCNQNMSFIISCLDSHAERVERPCAGAIGVSPRQRQDEAALNAFLGYVEVLEFPDKASSHYAQIRAHLKTAGSMIRSNDLFIAAHARSLGITLVTHNTQEFSQVPELAVEDWTIAL